MTDPVTRTTNEALAGSGTSSSAGSVDEEGTGAAAGSEAAEGSQSAGVPEALRAHVAGLDELDERPVAEHVERYEALHDELQAALHGIHDPAD